MTTRPTLISLLGKSKLDAQTGYRTAKAPREKSRFSGWA